jgi:manganese/iron transport system permease protein/iron/zinc/copper transport system permease protein
VVGGLYLCVWLDSSGGGAIMLFCTLQFIIVLALAPRYGMLARWLRLRRMVPQQVVEDVLLAILRNGPTPVSALRNLLGPGSRSGRILRSLTADGVLEETGGAVTLTKAGRQGTGSWKKPEGR